MPILKQSGTPLRRDRVGQRDKLDTRPPSPFLRVQRHEVVRLPGKACLHVKAKLLRLRDRDRIVMRVVAARKLLGDRLRALGIGSAGEQVGHDLLHVAECLLRHVGHEQGCGRRGAPPASSR
jgi:hypothetical protein